MTRCKFVIIYIVLSSMRLLNLWGFVPSKPSFFSIFLFLIYNICYSFFTSISFDILFFLNYLFSLHFIFGIYYWHLSKVSYSALRGLKTTYGSIKFSLCLCNSVSLLEHIFSICFLTYFFSLVFPLMKYVSFSALSASLYYRMWNINGGYFKLYIWSF